MERNQSTTTATAESQETQRKLDRAVAIETVLREELGSFILNIDRPDPGLREFRARLREFAQGRKPLM